MKKYKILIWSHFASYNKIEPSKRRKCLLGKEGQLPIVVFCLSAFLCKPHTASLKIPESGN